MGTILASASVLSARFTLLDPSPGKTFSDARFLVLYNEALRAMACVKPDLYTVQGALTMVAGTEQVLPAGGNGLLKLIKNVASGKPINRVSESLLLEVNRWVAPATQEVDVESFCVDARDENRFIITPPNNGTGSVLGLYGSTPTVASLATAIPFDDVYEPALTDWILSLAYRADTTRQDLSKSTQYENAAMKKLGLDSQSKAAAHPALGKPGGN